MSTASDTLTAILVVAIYGIIILLLLLSTVFWIVELVDAVRRDFPDANTRIMWVLIIIFLHGLGALIYYFFGKPQGRLPGPGLRDYPTRPSHDAWPPPPSAWRSHSDPGPAPPKV